jgi:8-oxo-dGTP pyrophosphatase MutT (NUDIX family)
VIILEAGNVRFNVRTAGVCLHAGHVLLHQADGHQEWSLPGGHPDAGEPAGTALAREWQEELGLSVRIGGLLWIVENFFPYAGQLRHEIGFYFAVTLPNGAAELDPHRQFVRHPADVNYALTFRWFPVGALASVPFYPAFLRTALTSPPAQPVHVIETGDQWTLSPGRP